MTYKGHLTEAMSEIGATSQVLFVGYGLSFYSCAAGTLVGVPREQRVEMPLAENLMMSAAIGMSLEGFLPVVFFERFDFILNAMDAIVNHLDKLDVVSGGEFKPCVIMRVVVGNAKRPLFTGLTHTQDFSLALSEMVSFPVFLLQDSKAIAGTYREAFKIVSQGASSVMVVEYKDKYDEE